MYVTVGSVLDILLAVLFLVALVRGWLIGLALTAAHLAVVVASVFAAWLLSGIVGIPMLSGVFFAIAFAVFWQVAKLVKLVDLIPVIGKLDRLGGAVAGFLIVFVVCCVVFAFLDKVIPGKIWDSWGLTKEAVEKTYILQAFLRR